MMIHGLNHPCVEQLPPEGVSSLSLGEFNQTLKDPLVGFIHSFIYPSNHPPTIFQALMCQVLDQWIQL